MARPRTRAAPADVACRGGARAFGRQALLPALAAAGWTFPRPRPVFGHGARAVLEPAGDGPALTLFGCYHVSRQHTFTGRLTPQMLRGVLADAWRASGGAESPVG